ncbi:phospholipid/cholesterol/gamma-HCH transport system substrate-binding protein [Variovorax sp. HW608]|uniref:MlaD family protein n=1 Tax=Variovorax sp. HW608 TaxID=1034889 RepID=UPI00081F8B69|nr:MlaD family protein [Variovorax sp. HW608]SCK58157.1 phospholipid/cholesterol/gamma-HCH transport system substrate-binding protein [Variovorax sp. HW608]
MDDKVNYGLVGAFVLLLGAALVAGVLWLAAGAHGGKRYGTYQSIMRESVSGLNVDAPVKYLGVDVGKVKEIAIDPADSSQVRLRFLIEQGTPIKKDTEAVLKTQGLTGIAYVELSGGTARSPPLRAANAEDIPTIPSKPSLSTRLESVLSTVLASVDRMSSNLNAIFDADTRAALKQMLADTAALTHTLAEQQAALSSGIADAARTAGNTARASEHLDRAVDRIAAAADSVDRMAGKVNDASERVGRSVEAAAGGLQAVSADAAPALANLLGEMNQLAVSLQRLSEQTERNPNSLLVGAPTRRPGPGEGARP